MTPRTGTVKAPNFDSDSTKIFCFMVQEKHLYHRERILETSTLSCNEEEEEITKPPTR